VLTGRSATGSRPKPGSETGGHDGRTEEDMGR